MTQSRADRRQHHIIIKTVCNKTGRQFISAHSTDDLKDGHLGSGSQLWRSIDRHGVEQHTATVFECLESRQDLKARKKELDLEHIDHVKPELKVSRTYRVIDRKYHVIYRTTCSITGKYYIGLHSTDDLNDGYQGSGVHLTRSLKKHGKENHITEIVESLPDRGSLIIREAELVNEKLLKDEMCMNLMLGGSAPLYDKAKLKEQARAKISATSKAMWERRKANPIALAEHNAKTNKPEQVIKRAEAIKAKAHKRSPAQLERMKSGQANHYASQTSEQKIERQRKGSWGRTKTWRVESETGSIELVNNIQAFAIQKGIPVSSIYKTEKSGKFKMAIVLWGVSNGKSNTR